MSEPTRRIRIHPSTLHRELDSETVLLQLDTGEYFGLDPMATRMWQLMVEHGSVADVADAVADEFDVEPVVAAADVARLVEELVAKRLIEVETI